MLTRCVSEWRRSCFADWGVIMKSELHRVARSMAIETVNGISGEEFSNRELAESQEEVEALNVQVD